MLLNYTLLFLFLHIIKPPCFVCTHSISPHILKINSYSCFFLYFFSSYIILLFFQRQDYLFVDFTAFTRYFSISCKTNCIKCHIRHRFQRRESLPPLPLLDVRSGNHAIHSAPPPVLPLAKLRRFSLIGDTMSLLVFPHSTQHRQHRHTGEVDFRRVFVIFMQLRHTPV